MYEAQFYETRPDGRVQCQLCPHNCILGQQQAGVCGVRENREGRLYTRNYGQISALSMDPIEKKPLFHYYPGRSILSAGTLGCNMRCRFCQNHTISQYYHSQLPISTQFMSPLELLDAARNNASFGIAYTYSEPVVWYEFILDTARLAREAGIKNILVTNGFIQPAPLAELLEVTDALNIDLKAFDSARYRSLGGRLETVQETIRTCHEAGIPVEVTTLVVTGFNDSRAEMDRLFNWLAVIDPAIPLHLTRYHPSFQYTAPSTDPDLLTEHLTRARSLLQYVYLGNMPGEQDSFCPVCSSRLISREGYHTRITGLSRQGRSARCTHCSAVLPFILGPEVVNDSH